jgi:hypothetical protein
MFLDRRTLSMPWKDLALAATQMAHCAFFYRVQLRASEEAARCCPRSDRHLTALELAVPYDVPTRTEPSGPWCVRALIDNRLSPWPSTFRPTRPRLTPPSVAVATRCWRVDHEKRPTRRSPAYQASPTAPDPGRWRHVELVDVEDRGPWTDCDRTVGPRRVGRSLGQRGRRPGHRQPPPALGRAGGRRASTFVVDVSGEMGSIEA